MLPYTPLHYLLLRAFATLKAPHQPAAVVMTGGKVRGEPLIYRDDEAWKLLRPLVDGMLTHNREIYTCCDDSVLRFTAGATQFVRRARGYVPEPIELSFEMPIPLLACGGQLKNTFCLGQGRQAILSQHMGNLENLETLHAFRQESEHFQRLFALTPAAVAHDLHPSYLASRYALSLKVPHTIGVQHHHAHIASVMAEHGLEGPLLGVAADGAGYGTDGAIWGCEIMRADLGNFQRLAHLAYVPLPGGEQAVRQPWRMATAYLQLAYGPQALELDIPFVRQLNRARWRSLTQIIEKGIHCPLTSSLGRLFDAVAALLGLVSQSNTRLHEGQAAAALERLARADNTTDQSYPYTISGAEPATLDVMPLIRALVDEIRQEIPAARIARRFHISIAALLAESCARARRQTGLNVVALSGDCFQNQLLLEQLIDALEKMAFLVFINRRVPPNDGGLSLGQLAIAATHLRGLSARGTGEQEHHSPRGQENLPCVPVVQRSPVPVSEATRSTRKSRYL
jgi:hydrogenase maturation protein HypF